MHHIYGVDDHVVLNGELIVQDFELFKLFVGVELRDMKLEFCGSDKFVVLFDKRWPVLEISNSEAESKDLGGV